MATILQNRTINIAMAKFRKQGGCELGVDDLGFGIWGSCITRLEGLVNFIEVIDINEAELYFVQPIRYSRVMKYY